MIPLTRDGEHHPATKYPALAALLCAVVTTELLLHGHEVKPPGQIPDKALLRGARLDQPLPDEVLAGAPHVSIDTAGAGGTQCAFTFKVGGAGEQMDPHHAEAAIRSACAGMRWEVHGTLAAGEGRIACRAAGVVSGVEEACKSLHEDLVSRAHSHRAARSTASHELLRAIAGIAAAHTPSKISVGTGEVRPTGHKKSLDSWKQFVQSIDDSQKIQELSHTSWRGKGLVTMAGSADTLPQAVVAVAFIRKKFGCNMPAEVWQSEHEVTSYTPDFLQKLKELDIVIRSLPLETIPQETKSMFSLKPAAILASSFDEVVFFDSDAVLIEDPRIVLRYRDAAHSSAVFWPDYWTMLHDATIWDSFPWPYGDSKHGPSQESGLIVTCKTCGGWKGLALAFFLNFHSTVYYEAIYYGHFGEKTCMNKPCYRDGRYMHYMPGVGDKDTFAIAWLGLGLTYQMMRPSALAGNMTLNHGKFICGDTMLQRGPSGRPILVHHNSNKWWWHDMAQRRWDSVGFALSHLSEYASDSQAFQTDSQNMWKSAFYDWHPDAGGQKRPAYTRWCVVYREPVNTQPLEERVGWNPGRELQAIHMELYSEPWMVVWVESQARLGPPRYIGLATVQNLAVAFVLMGIAEYFR